MSSTFLQDLRYALRSMGRTPAFTAAVLVTLGLGIGADIAIFSVAHGVLLKPLPYPAADRLLRIGHVRPDSRTAGASFSPQDFEDLGHAKTGFESLAAWMYQPNLTGSNLTGAGEPQRVETASVSGAFFPTVGSSAHLGRTIRPEDDRAGSNHVVVLSDSFWKRLGADPHLVGRSIRLDDVPYTVIGVMPRTFAFPAAEVETWVPLSNVGDDAVPHQRAIRWLDVVGRLAPGERPESARASVDTVLARLASQYPDSNAGFERSLLVPLETSLTGDARTPILVLLCAVSLVLVIACANVAHLLLARASARQREAAIRTALGASRARLIRQRLTESLALSLAGGLVGLLVARWGVDALTSRLSTSLPRAAEVGLDASVVAFGFLVSLLAGLAAGVLPAIQASRTNLRGAIEAATSPSGTSAESGRRLRRGLVLAETALAVSLVFGAGLLIRSFWRLTHVDSGMRTDAVFATAISIPAKYEDDEGAREAAYRTQVLDRLRALPGVLAVGGSKTWPLYGGGEPYGFTVEGAASSETIKADMGAIIVTPGYFEALGIPVLRGRAFTQADLETSAKVLLVNRTLADRLWPHQDPLGKGLIFGGRMRIEVVGVAADVRAEGLAAPARAALYVPVSLFPRSSLKIFLRADGHPAQLSEAVRAAIRAIEPDQPVAPVVPFGQIAAETVSRPRLLTELVALFGTAALLLAALGIYGVLSYGVARRTREIGIRMALGADAGDVRRLIVQEGMALALAGLALGVVGALVFGRLLRSVLFEVPASDGWTLMGVAVLLAGVAWLATWIPARRATRIDPMIALRSE